MRDKITNFWERAEKIPRLNLRYSVLYLGLPCLLLVFQQTSINERFMGQYFFPFGLFGLCLLVGWKHVKPYHRLTDNLKNTFRIGVIILIWKWILSIGVIKLSLVGKDPQGLSDVVYSTKETLNNLLRLPFIAAGEEYYIWLVVLGTLSLIALPGKARIILTILIVSLIFGFHHVISYQRITALLPIAATAIPPIIFTIYYRSILPAIIAHFLFDFTAFMGHWGNNGIILTQLAITIIVLIVMFFKPYKGKVTR